MPNRKQNVVFWLENHPSSGWFSFSREREPKMFQTEGEFENVSHLRGRIEWPTSTRLYFKSTLFKRDFTFKHNVLHSCYFLSDPPSYLHLEEHNRRYSENCDFVFKSLLTLDKRYIFLVSSSARGYIRHISLEISRNEQKPASSLSFTRKSVEETAKKNAAQLKAVRGFAFQARSRPLSCVAFFPTDFPTKGKLFAV